MTPAYASRAVWIIRVFLFLILESTLSYVRQLEARVRQLEEENRVLPQVGDFCCVGTAARQQRSRPGAGDQLSVTCPSALLHLNTQVDHPGNQRHSHLLFILLGTEWGIY